MTYMNDIYKKVKIDWTRFFIETDDCQNDSPIEFEVMPEDYLDFAKNNIRKSDLQNCIDGISNAKRAIECQIDLLISTLGFDYKKFDSRNNYPHVKDFIKKYYKEQQYDGLTDRLKLLNILGLAPTLLISNIRKLRNLIEHEYKKISYEDVKVAVEVADLFINASNRKLCFSPTSLSIGNNKKNKGKIGFEYYYIDVPFLEIIFRIYHSTDTVRLRCITTEGEEKNFNSFYELKPDDKFYIDFIYCLLSNEYTILPQIFDCNIGVEYINYEFI